MTQRRDVSRNVVPIPRAQGKGWRLINLDKYTLVMANPSSEGCGHADSVDEPALLPDLCSRGEPDDGTRETIGGVSIECADLPPVARTVRVRQCQKARKDAASS